MNFTVDYRSTDEMKIPGFKGLDDRFGILGLTPEKRSAFVNRPYREVWDVYCQKVFHSEGIAFACEIQYPLLINTPEGRQVYLGGSTAFVAEEYRKFEVGGFMRDYTEVVSPGYGSCGASLSQMMVKVMQKMRRPVFLMPRLIMLFRTRSVVEMKFSGFVSVLLSKALDSFACVWYSLLKTVECFMNRRYSFVVVSPDDEDSLRRVADIIESEKSLFSEVHDVPWLKWMMTASFVKEGPMQLVAIKIEDRIVGFYMLKKRFHEQASSRGFKNVWLASVMEWGVAPQTHGQLKWFLLHAALTNMREVDACELVFADRDLVRFFRFMGACPVGQGNFTFAPPLGKKPPYYAEMKKMENWRLRPAMGDAGLN